MNLAPQWSNVYNKVTVELHNSEFGGVTTKEVAAGLYLDMVAKQDLSQDVEDVFSLPQLCEIAKLQVDSLVNNQNQKTSIFIAGSQLADKQLQL